MPPLKQPVSLLRMLARIVLLVMFSALVAAPGRAAAPAKPEIDTIQERLETARADTALSATDKRTVLEMLQSAIDRLRDADQLEQQARQYSQTASSGVSPDSPEAIRFAQYQTQGDLTRFRNASIDTLEQQLAQTQADVASLRSTQSEVQSELEKERELALPSLVGEAQQAVTRLASIATQNGETTGSDPVASATSLAQEAEYRFQTAKVQALRERLATRPARLKALQNRVDRLGVQLAEAERVEVELLRMLDEKRLLAIDSRMNRLRAVANRVDADKEALKKLATENLQLGEALDQVVQRNKADEARRNVLSQRISTLDAKFDSLNKLLRLREVESSAVFGTALRREWDKISERLLNDTSAAATARTLTTSRVALFDLQERQGAFKALGNDQLRALGLDPASSLVAQIVLDRSELIDELQRAQQQLIDGLSTHLGQVQRYDERSNAYTALLKSHLFWIPSTSAFGPTAFKGAGAAVRWLSAPERWAEVRDELIKTVSQSPLPALILLLLIAIPCKMRGALKKRLEELAPRIGKVQHDRFGLTASAFLVTFGLAAPAPLAIFAVASALGNSAGLVGSLKLALMTGAIVMAFMEFILQLARPYGLAEVHFRWRPETLALLRHHNRWLIILFVPIVVIMVLLDNQATPDIRDGLGRFALLVMCLSLSFTAWRTAVVWKVAVRAGKNLNGSWYRATPANPIFTIYPLVLAVLSLFGYHYTAGELLDLSLRSVALITVAVLVYYTLERYLAIYERRLALERLLTKRAEAAARNAERDAVGKAGEGIPEIIDSQVIDRQTITNQTTALLKLLVWGGLIVGLVFLWHDLLPVVRSLDDQVLWQVAPTDSGQPIQRITWWNLSVALVVLTGTFLAVKNLPGALEVAVLSRLNLAPGTGYAVTSVLKYLLAFAGVLTVFNMLGTDWSKLQWLIAALGVGLGFGLQEIVANFVSGIVILFEKPFRLGDTITINNQSGTVTRIQIRATTVSDWDRKEIIIPNKTFITGTFVNWTLADTMTRLIIPVGVAYGSDTGKVVNALTQIAAENARVLADPAPAILFISFGASSLDFEMRVFTRTLADRVVLAHELHMAIDAVFRREGIEIPFPQLDVHYDPEPPADIGDPAPG